jgi:hypothetical protein
VAKSSAAEHVRRVNATIRLLEQEVSAPRILAELVARYDLSRRQAYRYLYQAQQAGSTLAVPEGKAVFTVKVPSSLIVQVRRRAKQQRVSIGAWVAQALRKGLDEPKLHGSI